MGRIVKGYLVESNGRIYAGEYWTAVNDYYTICISYKGKLLSMNKGKFGDWLQLNHLLYDELIAIDSMPACFNPFDVGMDVEESTSDPTLGDGHLRLNMTNLHLR